MRNYLLGFCLIALFASLSTPVLATVADNYEKALQSYHANNIDESYIHLKNALTESPSHLPSKILMGQVLLLRGNIADALLEFKEAREFGADVNIVALPLAKAYLFMEQYRNVISMSTQNLDGRNLFEILLLKGTAHNNLGEYDQAAEFFKQSIELDSTNTRALNSLASYYLQQGFTAQAVELINASIALEPNNSRTIHLQGKLAAHNENYAEALGFYQKAYELSPANPIIKRSFASALVRAERYQEARALVDEIIEQTPDDPLALLLRGRLLSENADVEAAQNAFEEITQLLTSIPDDVQAQNNEILFATALASYMAGNYQAAANELERYVSRNKDNVNALGVLADTYIKLDQVRKAQLLLERSQQKVTKNLGLSLVLCDLFLRTDKTFKCAELLSEIEKKFKNNESITYMRVRVLQADEQHNEALALFTENFPEPSFEPLTFMSVNLYVQTGQFDKAIERTNSILQSTTNPVRYQLMKSEILFKQEKFSDALKYANEVLDNEAQNVQANALKAQSLLALNQFEDAEKIAAQLVQAQPTSVFHNILLGQALTFQQKYEQALQVLYTAKSLSRKNPIPSELITRIYTEQRDFDNALRELELLTKEFFLVPEYVEAKANIHLAMGQPKLAAKQLNFLYGIWNDSPRQLLRLSRLHVIADDTDGALRALNRALTLAPERLSLQLEMVRLRLSRNELERAQVLTDRLTAATPNNSSVLLIAGEVAKEKQRYAKAHQYFLAALKLDPLNRLAFVRLYQLASNDIAIDSFLEESTRLFNTHPQLHFQRSLLADFLTATQEYSKAKEHYEIIINDYEGENIARIYNNYAIVLLAQGTTADSEKALVYASKAVDVNNTNASFVDTKGWVLASSGKYESALPYLRRAFSLDSNNPAIRYHLAFTLNRLNRVDEARSELIAAIASQKHFKERKSAQALLDSI